MTITLKNTSPGIAIQYGSKPKTHVFIFFSNFRTPWIKYFIDVPTKPLGEIYDNIRRYASN